MESDRTPTPTRNLKKHECKAKEDSLMNLPLPFFQHFIMRTEVFHLKFILFDYNFSGSQKTTMVIVKKMIVC